MPSASARLISEGQISGGTVTNNTAARTTLAATDDAAVDELVLVVASGGNWTSYSGTPAAGSDWEAYDDCQHPAFPATGPEEGPGYPSTTTRHMAPAYWGNLTRSGHLAVMNDPAWLISPGVVAGDDFTFEVWRSNSFVGSIVNSDALGAVLVVDFAPAVLEFFSSGLAYAEGSSGFTDPQGTGTAVSDLYEGGRSTDFVWALCLVGWGDAGVTFTGDPDWIELYNSVGHGNGMALYAKFLTNSDDDIPFDGTLSGSASWGSSIVGYKSTEPPAGFHINARL